MHSYSLGPDFSASTHHVFPCKFKGFAAMPKIEMFWGAVRVQTTQCKINFNN